jgi:hypothetical protein
MYLIPTPTRRLVSPAMRDRFLAALDRRDEATVRETARDLLGCANYLPTATCIQLGLAPGSTYGDAAETITRPPAAQPEVA